MSNNVFYRFFSIDFSIDFKNLSIDFSFSFIGFPLGQDLVCGYTLHLVILYV